MKFIDITGQRFGRLTVIELDVVKSKETGFTYWICKCDCGNIVSVLGTHLRSGRTKSCGCLQKEVIRKRSKKYNHIEFDKYLGCYRVYLYNCNEYFLIDTEDKKIIEQYCWCKNDNGYIITNVKDENGRQHTIRLHRLIMSKYYNINGFDIDHINHNKLDNRKCNLRICNRIENNTNRRPLSNTGYKYISYTKEGHYKISPPNAPSLYTYSLNEGLIYLNDYYNKNPNDFYYDPNEDYINKNNENSIHPFIFINPENIVQPFKFIDR